MSKKSFGIIFLLAVIFCSFHSVSAQEGTFKEEDLTALKKAAGEKLAGKIYRHTTIVSTYFDGDETPNYIMKSILEIIPPDRSRYISMKETSKGVAWRSESIRVGKRRFRREDNGEWKEEKESGGGIGGGEGSGYIGYKLEKTIERKLKKGEVAGNKKVDLYETFSTYKYIYPLKTITKVWKEIYSFDADGMFVKREEEYNDGSNSVRKTVEEYEYDPNIKIEAPALREKTE
jgi:hypothetical protein